MTGISPAAARDEAAIRGLLAGAGLPTEDLSAELLQNFLVLHDAGLLIGTVGLEVSGSTALLRSLAVDAAQRQRGHGLALLSAAEALAVGRGVRNLYLLTTSAENFFAAHGYVKADRERAPSAIRATAQFRGLCPASSAFMVRGL